MSPFLLLLALTVFPGNAWAVQSHGAPEGLYVHQLAHIFYTASMAYLLWGLRRSEFKSKGWLFLQGFCVFIILWNIVAFTGHFLASHVDKAHFIYETGYLIDNPYFTFETGYLSTRLDGPFTGFKLLFYFTKLDHIFSIPALFCLYLAMKGIYRSSLEEEDV
jgi:hypothetical protein